MARRRFPSVSRAIGRIVDVAGLRFDPLVVEHGPGVREELRHHAVANARPLFLRQTLLRVRKGWHGETGPVARQVSVGLAVQVRPHVRERVGHRGCASTICLLIGCQGQGGDRVKVWPGVQRHVTGAL